MDTEKFVQELSNGELGDHIRDAHVQDMLAELAGGHYDDDREWANGVAEWLRDNYL